MEGEMKNVENSNANIAFDFQLEDFNKIPKVSFNNRLKLYYHSRSKLVYKSRNNLQVIGRIENRNFVPYDFITKQLCVEHNQVPDPDLDSKLEIKNNDTIRNDMEDAYLLSCIREYMNSAYDEIKNRKEKKTKPIRILNESKSTFVDSVTDKQEDQCPICYENKKVFVLIPCGHICYCNSCLKNAQQISKSDSCPLCKTKVESAVRMFQ